MPKSPGVKVTVQSDPQNPADVQVFSGSESAFQPMPQSAAAQSMQPPQQGTQSQQSQQGQQGQQQQQPPEPPPVVHKVHVDIMIPLSRLIAGTIVLVVLWVMLGIIFGSIISPLFGSTGTANAAQGTIASINMILHVLLVLAYLVFAVCVATIYINDYYLITPDVLKINKGVLFTKNITCDLRTVESIETTQGLIGKLFGYGTIKCLDVRLNPLFSIYNVPNPTFYSDIIAKYHIVKRDGKGKSAAAAGVGSMGEAVPNMDTPIIDPMSPDEMPSRTITA
jgi:membrane protein YdbS with pleckstrin-like domain